MSYVGLMVEEDFESCNWDVIENSDTEFQARIGPWTILARDSSTAGLFIVTLMKGDCPMFEDGFCGSAEARGAILALRQVLMNMTNGNPDWPQW